MKIIALVKDLFFKSKIDVAASLTGKKVEFLDDIFRVHGADLILVDLEEFGLEGLQKIQEENNHVKIIGFLSHKRMDLFARAQGMGIDTMPRSVFVQKLNDILSTH